MVRQGRRETGGKDRSRDASGRRLARRNPLNPARQAVFVLIALAGIGIGYGVGYLFKPAQPPPAPPADAATPAPPLLPEEVAKPGDHPVRPYEEALPRDIVESVNGIGAKFEEPPPPPPEAPPLAAEPPPAAPADPPASQPTTAPAKVKAGPAPAVAAVPAGPRPRIAIVIDDLGIDRARTARAIKLPGPLTLSFLTYAGDLGAQTRAAADAGHDLLIHVPMEPASPDVDPGPNVLLTGVPRDELLSSLRWNLDQFGGYVGVNNHMGSRFTADMAGMTVVMEELKARGLLFLDSMTAADSVGRRAARQAGVPVTVRNVFLDHEDNIAAIKKRLAEVERLARRAGRAVAIGHPREATLRALGPWLAGIGARGFDLVPISALVAKPPAGG